MNKVNIPTITSSAMLVELSISSWGGNMTDPEITDRLHLDAGAKKKVGTFTKNLMKHSEPFKAIHTQKGYMRNHIHYRLSLPWTDTGIRLLSTEAFFNYQERMTAAIAEYNALVDKFIAEYYDEVEKAIDIGQGLYRREQFPDAQTLRGKFSASVQYYPLPQTGDFRLDIGDKAQGVVDELQAQYETAFAQKFADAHSDLMKRVLERLTKTSEGLGYKEDGKKCTFKDTFVDNVHDIIEVMRTCNISGDTQILAMADKLEKRLNGVTPDMLRHDDLLRDDTKQMVDQAIKELPSLGW